MSTNAQINANQQNAKHSTGPKTEEGKATAAKNSFRHGLTASPMSMMLGEKVQDYMDLGNGMRAEHKPATITEDALVTKMIESLWLAARAVRLQQSIVFDPEYKRKDFELYMRYQTMHNRAFSQALNDLVKLRKEARQQEIGSVPQEQIVKVQEAKIRNLNARSEACERRTELRKAASAAPAAVVSVPQPIAIPRA